MRRRRSPAAAAGIRQLLAGAGQSAADWPAAERDAVTAFLAAMVSPEGGLRLHERRDLGVRRIDVALEELARATPKLKRSIVQACATCVAHDGTVTLEEVPAALEALHAPTGVRTVALL